LTGRGYGLGLDGGGSATRWAVADPGGEIVAAGELPPVSGHLFQQAERENFAAVLQALAGAVPPGIGAIVAGITGLSAGSESGRLAVAMLSAALGVAAPAVHVEDDVWIAYHAAFRPGEGHLVYAGTGSVGLHLAADGTALRVGGRGMLIDDAGSAFWLGREALDRLFRHIDEAGEVDGPLADAVFAVIGARDWDSVRGYAYGGGRTTIALLARAVASAAEMGDAQALALLREAGTELARLARALTRRVGPLPVSLAGRAASLHPAILAAMRAAAPGLSITPASPDAAAAAARIAARS
jgi:N-acetylglucosamine kinase-like BadF-type ATPase